MVGAALAAAVWMASLGFGWDYMDAVQITLAGMDHLNLDNLIFSCILIGAGLAFDFARARARLRRSRELNRARLMTVHAAARTLEDTLCNDLTAMLYILEATETDEALGADRRAKLLDQLRRSIRQIQDLLTLEDAPETLDSAGQARLDLEQATRSEPGYVRRNEEEPPAGATD